jgi:hypothetical protein
MLFFPLFFTSLYTGASNGQGGPLVRTGELFCFWSLFLSFYVCSHDSRKSVRHLISRAPPEVLSKALETSCIIIPLYGTLVFWLELAGVV